VKVTQRCLPGDATPGESIDCAKARELTDCLAVEHAKS